LHRFNNERPRKISDGETPKKAFQKLIVALKLEFSLLIELYIL